MTEKELAQTLHNFDVRDSLSSGNLTKEDFQSTFAAAEKAGLVIVFIQGDDVVRCLGAIEDEIGVYEKDAIYFVNGELFTEEKMEHAILSFHRVSIQWDYDGYYRHLSTSLPHSSFDLLDRDLEGQRYCRGIVFDKYVLKS